MKKSLFILSLITLTSSAASSSIKYKCRVEIQDKNLIRSLEIPYNLKAQNGELIFDDARAQKAEYHFFGDALKMELFIKSKTEWQSIAQSVSSGQVRAAMLKGPPGLLISCQFVK